MHASIGAFVQPVHCLVVEVVQIANFTAGEETLAGEPHDAFDAALGLWAHWKMRQRAETVADGHRLVRRVPANRSTSTRDDAGLEIIDQHFRRNAAEELE